MRRLAHALLLPAVIACSSSAPPSNTPGPSAPTPNKPAPADPTSSKPAAFDPTHLGEPCPQDASCPPPTRCVSYSGIAGPRGPQFESCEIKCGKDTKDACPEGTKCVTIADGPGAVCRK